MRLPNLLLVGASAAAALWVGMGSTSNKSSEPSQARQKPAAHESERAEAPVRGRSPG